MPGSVLIVDDERETNDLLAQLVQAKGFAPIQLYQGNGAVETVNRNRPDVVLLDVMLPDIDGFTICEELKRNRETNLTPVIMVTALNGVAHHTRGERVGANCYVTKPFHMDRLFQTIDDALAWRREHEQKGVTGEITFDIRSELHYLQQLNDLLADLYAHTPLTERQIKDLRQAVHEMGSNAIEWGHKKNAELSLIITYRISHDRVTLIIRDQGPGFDPGHLPHAASEDDPIGHLDVRLEQEIREGGFGIMLAKGMVDEFRYNEKGNEVTLVKRFSSPGPNSGPQAP